MPTHCSAVCIRVTPYHDSFSRLNVYFEGVKILRNVSIEHGASRAFVWNISKTLQMKVQTKRLNGKSKLKPNEQTSVCGT